MDFSWFLVWGVLSIDLFVVSTGLLVHKAHMVGTPLLKLTKDQARKSCWWWLCGRRMWRPVHWMLWNVPDWGHDGVIHVFGRPRVKVKTHEDTNFLPWCDLTWKLVHLWMIYLYLPIRNGDFPVCKLFNNQWVPCCRPSSWGHGTGTALGDPIEVGAIKAALGCYGCKMALSEIGYPKSR